MSLAEKLNSIKKENTLEKENQEKQAEENKQEEINKKMAVLTAKRQELEEKLAYLKNSYSEGAQEKADWKEENQKIAEIFKDNTDVLADQGVKYAGDLFKNDDFSEEKEIVDANEAEKKVHERISGLKAQKKEIKEIGGLEKENITKEEAENILKEKIAEINRESQELLEQSPEYHKQQKIEMMATIEKNHENKFDGNRISNVGLSNVVKPEDLALAEKYGEEEVKQALKEYWEKIGDRQAKNEAYGFEKVMKEAENAVETFPAAEASFEKMEAALEKLKEKFSLRDIDQALKTIPTDNNLDSAIDFWKYHEKNVISMGQKEIIRTKSPFFNCQTYKEYFDRVTALFEQILESGKLPDSSAENESASEEEIKFTRIEIPEKMAQRARNLGFSNLEEYISNNLQKGEEKREIAKELADTLVDESWAGNYENSQKGQEMLALSREVKGNSGEEYNGIIYKEKILEDTREKAKKALIALISKEDDFAILNDAKIINDYQFGPYSDFHSDYETTEKEINTLTKKREEIKEKLRENNRKGKGFLNLRAGQIEKEREELKTQESEIANKLKEKNAEYDKIDQNVKKKEANIKLLNNIFSDYVINRKYRENIKTGKTFGEVIALMKEELKNSETASLSPEEEEKLEKYKKIKADIDGGNGRINELRKKFSAE